MSDNSKPEPEHSALDSEISVSFELFPPMSAVENEKLMDVAKVLDGFGPAFISVTYGAGGGTQKRTLETLERVSRQTHHNLAGHLTCVGASKAETNAVAEKYRALGVKSIVALRGDAPKGADKFRPHPQGYQNAADLVAGLTDIGGFDISVAAYPESHPDSPSREADLANLKTKLEAGADRAITQFFFDNQLYYDFISEARSHGIDKPIVPGILLINDFWKVKRFAKMCSASIPPWLEQRFEGLEDDRAAHQETAVAIAIEQIKDLIEHGVDHFHLYTMNNSDLVSDVCNHLRMGERGRKRQVA